MSPEPTVPSRPDPSRCRAVARFLVGALGAVLFLPGGLAAQQSAGERASSERVRKVKVRKADYAAAERMLRWHARPLIAGDAVEPEWMEGGDQFWYRRKTGTGHHFIFVDPPRNVRRPLFDHHRLAAAMSQANDSAYVGDDLPFDDFDFVDGSGETRIEFRLGEKRFECHIRDYACEVGDTLPSEVPFVESPDGQWEAFVQEHDLYVRSTETGDTVRLTEDGEEFFSYGLDHPSPTDVMEERKREPTVVWAPDSRKLVTTRNDQRDVKHMHYISYTPQRPKHYSQPYELPGDTLLTLPAFHIIDIETKENIRVELEPRPTRLYLRGSASDSAWSADSERYHVAWQTRGSKSKHLAEVDAFTGEYTILASDSARTFVDWGSRGGWGEPNWYVTEDGRDVIWWSERTGWAHLWRYGPDGQVKNQITSAGYAPEDLTRFECEKVQRSGGDPLRFEVCERRLIADA